MHKLRMKIVEHNAIPWNCGGCGLFIFGLFTVLLLTSLSRVLCRNFKTQNDDKSWMDAMNKTVQATAEELTMEINVLKNEVEHRTLFPMPLIMKSLNRNKREILFDGGGVVKLILGVSLPINLPDRSLACFYNLQLQYTPPPQPLYAWSLFNTTTFPVSRTFKTDVSREYIYAAIETFFERSNLPGTRCLLKMICELARKPFYVTNQQKNIYHEIFNAIFTPKLPNVNSKYLNAYQAGRHGALCSYRCPQHIDWLERNSVYV